MLGASQVTDLTRIVLVIVAMDSSRGTSGGLRPFVIVTSLGSVAVSTGLNMALLHRWLLAWTISRAGDRVQPCVCMLNMHAAHTNIRRSDNRTVVRKRPGQEFSQSALRPRSVRCVRWALRPETVQVQNISPVSALKPQAQVIGVGGDHREIAAAVGTPGLKVQCF